MAQIQEEHPHTEDVAPLARHAERTPPPVPRTPDRARRVVPVSGEAPRGGRETWIVFFAFWLVYGLIGYRVTIDQHVVVFDSLDRLSRAYLVWHNDPPKLAAVGFGVPPMTSFAYLPFTILKPLATSLIALPVFSGLFAAATLATINRLFMALGVRAAFRLLLLVAFAANPMFVFYASNGMSEVFYLWLMALGLYGFIEWYLSEQPRFLILAGMAFSVAMLTRYQFFIWAVLMALMIAAALRRRKAGPDEVEGQVIAYLAPVIYAAALWMLFNLLILGDPFGWLTDQQSSLSVNAAAGERAAGAGLGDVLANVFEVYFGLFPIAVVVLVGLLVTAVAGRNDMALWLAVFAVIGIVTVVGHALIEDDLGTLELRDAMVMSVIGMVGAAWLLYATDGVVRLLVFGVALVTLVVALPTAWGTMRDYRFQNQEQAFTRAIADGTDQEGTSSIGGYNVGIEPERRMAAFIKRNVRDGNTILTDNAQTFGVIVLSGRPQLFFDRIDRGDTAWRRTVDDPFGRVRYLLIASNAAGDLIRRRYPASVTTGVPGLSQAYKTDRYLLLRVGESEPGPGQASPAVPGPGQASPAVPGATP